MRLFSTGIPQNPLMPGFNQGSQKVGNCFLLTQGGGLKVNKQHARHLCVMCHPFFFFTEIKIGHIYIVSKLSIEKL